MCPNYMQTGGENEMKLKYILDMTPLTGSSRWIGVFLQTTL